MLKNGILNLLKPSDMSSQQAVQAVKRLIPCKKAGHSGTLDPAAAGVLPVFLGSATRLAEYAVEGDKEYIAEIHFGIETDTQDAQGQLTNKSDHIVSWQQMEALLASVPSELWQTPPQYSAIKIGGQKMVDLARKGKATEIPPRRVFIHEKQLLREVAQNAFLIRIRCSKGTYIRTLCHDLGRQSGAFAHCSFLLRTKSGPFELDRAITFEQISLAVENDSVDSLLLPLGVAVPHLTRISLSKADIRKIEQGQILTGIQAIDTMLEDQLCALWQDEQLIGIGKRSLDTIKPVKVFHGSE